MACNAYFLCVWDHRLTVLAPLVHLYRTCLVLNDYIIMK